MFVSAIVAGGVLFSPLSLSTAISAIQADGAKRLTVSYEGLVPLPVVGQLKAATASIDAWIGPAAYNINTRAQSAGIVDWFVDYNMFINSTGRISASGVTPVRYDSQNQDGKKKRHVTVDFTPPEVKTTVTPKFGDYGYPAATPEQKLQAMDPVSGILAVTLGVSATPENPCGGPLKSFDGKQRFDLRLKFNSRIQYKSAAYTGPALVCDLEYVEIAGFKARTSEKKAADKADIMWSNMVLAELPGGVTPLLKLEARSKKRGKLTIQATKLSYVPAK